nr:zinc finger protein JAGGED-like isoform X2 [Physcomitrium patens]|eukprot:XP_024371542.1 zinc finger protein JAGGED-like isoform X2 [Physcomitrella patens]
MMFNNNNNRDSQYTTASNSSVPPTQQNQAVVYLNSDGDEDNPNRRRKPEEDSENKFECRFCDMKFPKSQALGGHMNRHRVEREQEEIQKARNLLIAQQLPPPYYAGAQYYSRMDGASTSVDPTGNFPSTGGSFMTPQLPFYQPQAQSSVQNWLGNQITRPMERPSEAAETSVHLRGNSSRSQHTQSELPPRSTQFTQSEPTPRSTQFTRSEPQSNWLQATQHSDSDVDGLEYIN